MTRENPPVANESTETPNENKKKFNFDIEMDQFIEEKTNGKLTYFERTSSAKQWNEFYSFLEKKALNTDKYDAEFFESLEKGKTLYLKKLNYKATINLTESKNLINRAKKVFELDIDDFTAIEKNDLEKKLIESDSKELYSLIWSENLRNKFIQKHIITTPADFNRRKKVNVDRANIIFDKIFLADPAFLVRLKDLNDHSFDDLRESIFRFSDSAIRVRIEDIESILSQVPDNLKASLIKFFVPSITLQKALDLGLKTEKEVNDEIIRICISYGVSLPNDPDPVIEKQKQLEYIKSFSPNKFYIDTSLLDQNKIKDISNDSENLRKITDQINEGKNKIDAIFTRDDFLDKVKNSDKISEKIKLKSPNYFNTGNYIEISTPNKNGTSKKDYFYIKSINSMSVILVNVTKNTGVSATNEGIPEELPFGEVFNFFESYGKDDLDLLNTNDLNEKGVDKVSEEEKITTTDELQSFFNENDRGGKGVDIKKLAFTLKPKTGEKSEIYDDIFYYAVDVTPTKIVLNSGDVFEKGSLSGDLSDLARIFKERGGKRFSKLDTPTEFIETYSGKNDKFKDIIFDEEDNQFKPKDDKGKTEHNGGEYKGIEYFINDKGKDSIHIDELRENTVSFTVGDFKEDEETGKKTFKKEKKAEKFTYTQFFMYIKNKKLTPHSENEEVVEDTQHNHHAKHLHEHWFEPIAFWKKNFSSIGQLSSAFKHIGHTIQHNFEANDDLKSARLAMMFGKFIPSAHIQGELQADMEKKEKETVNKLKDHLQGVDSKDMIPQIKHILENKYSTKYEVEAAMFAVLKYGSLYPKDLSGYRGSNLWFKKLGGNEKDIPNMISELKKSDPGLVITEEVLVNGLLAKQAKSGYRRSKIHKEFGKEIKAGINDELGDGERESGERMTLDGRINYAMGEFKGGTFAHGIGCMENIIAKGPDPAWKINAIPFVIMAGGVSKHIDQFLIDKKVKAKGFSTPYHQLLLAGSPEKVDKYNDYVAKCIELSQGGADSKMYKDFKKISTKSNTDRVGEAYDFWKKYGKELYPIINMNDGFVVVKKDTPGNEDLKYYYDEVSGFHNVDNYFSPKSELIESGHFDAENGPIISDVMIKKIKIDDSGVIDEKTSKKVFDTYLEYLGKSVLTNSTLSEEEKKKIFFDVYSKLERYIYKYLRSFKGAEGLGEKWYNELGVYNDLRKKGFDLYDKIPENKTEEALEKFIQTEDYKKFLEEQYNNVKTGFNSQIANKVNAEVNHVKSSVSSLLQVRANKNASNGKKA